MAYFYTISIEPDLQRVPGRPFRNYTRQQFEALLDNDNLMDDLLHINIDEKYPNLNNDGQRIETGRWLRANKAGGIWRIDKKVMGVRMADDAPANNFKNYVADFFGLNQPREPLPQDAQAPPQPPPAPPQNNNMMNINIIPAAPVGGRRRSKRRLSKKYRSKRRPYRRSKRHVRR